MSYIKSYSLLCYKQLDTEQCSVHDTERHWWGERERDPRVRSLKVSEPLLNCSVVFSETVIAQVAGTHVETQEHSQLTQLNRLLALFNSLSRPWQIWLLLFAIIWVLICIMVSYRPADSLEARTSKDPFNHLGESDWIASSIWWNNLFQWCL